MMLHVVFEALSKHLFCLIRRNIHNYYNQNTYCAYCFGWILGFYYDANNAIRKFGWMVNWLILCVCKSQLQISHRSEAILGISSPSWKWNESLGQQYKQAVTFKKWTLNMITSFQRIQLNSLASVLHLWYLEGLSQLKCQQKVANSKFPFPCK